MLRCCSLFDPCSFGCTGSCSEGSCRSAATNCRFPVGPFTACPTSQSPPCCCCCCCCCCSRPPTAICANISEAAEPTSPAAARSDHPVASYHPQPFASTGQQQLGMGAVPAHLTQWPSAQLLVACLLGRLSTGRLMSVFVLLCSAAPHSIDASLWLVWLVICCACVSPETSLLPQCTLPHLCLH